MSEEHICDVCGNSYDSSTGLAIHKGKQHTPEYQKESVLRELYHKRGLSIVEVAEELGCARWQIQKYMDRHEIETDKSPADPDYPVYHTFKKRGDGQFNYTYEIIQTRIDGELRTVSIHRLIAVAIGELEPEDLFNSDLDIHHKSGHGLDNRPDNLEAVTRADHRERHSQNP